MATSFLNFARRLKSTDESFVEFRAVMKAAVSFPEPKTWQGLRGALNKIGASDVAIVGARMAWRRFESEKEAAN